MTQLSTNVIDRIERRVGTTLEEFLVSNLLVRLGADKLSGDWKISDWRVIVLGVILNKNDAQVFADLRLKWKKEGEESKLIDRAGIKFISITRKEIVKFKDELQELFSNELSVDFRFAAKVARIDSINFMSEMVEDQLKNNMIEEGANIASIENSILIANLVKLHTLMAKEMPQQSVFKHIHEHTHALDLSKDGLEKAAIELSKKLGVEITAETLADKLMEEKYREQMV